MKSFWRQAVSHGFSFVKIKNGGGECLPETVKKSDNRNIRGISGGKGGGVGARRRKRRKKKEERRKKKEERRKKKEVSRLMEKKEHKAERSIKTKTLC